MRERSSEISARSGLPGAPADMANAFSIARRSRIALIGSPRCNAATASIPSVQQMSSDAGRADEEEAALAAEEAAALAAEELRTESVP